MTRETKSYELKIYDQSLMRFEAAYDAFGSLKLEITDIDSANAHLLPLNLIVDQDEKSLASWMEGRTIPKNRAFVEQILSTAGLTRNDILGILDVSKGLSINDSYWLDDGKSDVTFDEINLFDNRFDEVLGLVAYTGYTPSQKHKAGVSSEWTLGGQFPKAVRRINDRLLLFKTGTSGARNLGKEPYSEYFAAQVAKRMGIDHVSYDLEMWKGKLASVCGLMNDKEISFVPFFVAAGDASFPAALSILNELDPKMASKYRTMVVFDALICNRDRHGGNFGILRENRTGRLLGLAPVFDHNLSLFAQDDETDYADFLVRSNRYYLPATANIAFNDMAGIVMGAEQHELLRRMIGFEFQNHPTYPLPQDRLGALLAVLRFALLHDRDGPAARAAFDFVGGAGRVVERRRADHVPDGLDSAAALGLAEVRHALLEVEDQVFGVHAAPIIAVYGVNDMAPWGHMYVNPGLTEPIKLF